MALVPIERQVNVATVAARLRQQMGLKDAATKEASEFATAAEGLLATTALQAESPLAAENLTGTIDPARIPVLAGNEQVVSSAGIADLTTEQQAVVLRGSIVTTTDGRRWVYTGSGSKVSEASYIVLADVTPEWSAVAGKPTFGDAAAKNTGTTAGTVAAGDDERIVGALQSFDVPIYATSMAVAALGIPVGIPAIRTNGYHTVGDGGDGLYKRVDGEPAHAGKLQSSDGAWWELVVSGSVNVKAMGAKGDNIADDSIAFQSAVDLLKTLGGGEIIIPGWGNVYNFQSKRDAGLTPVAFEDPNVFFSECNDISVRGVGNPVLTNSVYPNNRTEIFMFYKSNRCTVQGIVFQGNNTDLPTEVNNCGVGMLSCTGMKIRDNHLTGFQGSYIASSWLFDSVIEGNFFDVQGGTGVDCAFWQDVAVVGNKFYGNGLGSNEAGTQGVQHLFDTPNEGNNETGVEFRGGSSNNITIRNNLVEGFVTGIALGDAFDCRIDGNDITRNYLETPNPSCGLLLTNNDPSVTLFAMTGIVITGNSITRNGSPSDSGGIRIEKGTASLVEVTLTDNVIQDNSSDGVYPDTTVILKARGNRFGNKYTSDQTINIRNMENLGAGSYVIENSGVNPLAPIGPAIPSDLNVVKYNDNPSPALVIQESGDGMVLVSPTGVETVVFPGNAKTFKLQPYWGVKFTVTNTTGWLWTFD